MSPAPAPAYVPGLVSVEGVDEAGPAFARLRLRGEALQQLAPHGLDQRVKLLVPTLQPPRSHHLTATAGDWYDQWRRQSDREPMRTYTVVGPDPRTGRCDLLVMRHQPCGVVGEWLEVAQSGDQAVLVFPNAASPHSRQGIDWQPGDAQRLTLLADETALPAVLGILTTLPAHVRGDAVIESALPIDHFDIDSRGVQLVHLTRRPGQSPGSRLTAWVRARFGTDERVSDMSDPDALIWDSPAAYPRQQYLWCAAEATAVRSIRAIVLGSGALPRKDCAFMGYWKSGVAA